MNNKYFRVDDIKVADIMSILLNEKYYKFTDKNAIKTCFYPTRINTSDDIKAQIEYAESESESTTWKPSEINN